MELAFDLQSLIDSLLHFGMENHDTVTAVCLSLAQRVVGLLEQEFAVAVFIAEYRNAYARGDPVPLAGQRNLFGDLVQ